jgi:hypothetical protein
VIIVVSGSRHMKDPGPLESVLKRVEGTEHALLHGDQTGADTLAAHYGLFRGWNVEAFPADWKRFSTDAGPMRNAEMLLEAKRRSWIESVKAWLFAFPAPDSRGTTNCIALAKLLRVSRTVVEIRP